MRCPVCRETLMKISTHTRIYRDVDGRPYKQIRHPIYRKCSKQSPLHKRPAALGGLAR